MSKVWILTKKNASFEERLIICQPKVDHRFDSCLPSFTFKDQSHIKSIFPFFHESHKYPLHIITSFHSQLANSSKIVTYNCKGTLLLEWKYFFIYKGIYLQEFRSKDQLLICWVFRFSPLLTLICFFDQNYPPRNHFLDCVTLFQAFYCAKKGFSIEVYYVWLHVVIY